MTAKTLSRALESGLPPNLRMLAVAMADDAWDDGWCWSSKATLAFKSGYSRRHVGDLLKELSDADAIDSASPDEMPDDVRSRWEQLPANRRPVPYRLLFVAADWPGVKDVHPTDGDGASGERPSGVSQGSPQGASGGVKVSHPSLSSGVKDVHPSEGSRGELRGELRGEAHFPQEENLDSKTLSLPHFVRSREGAVAATEALKFTADEATDSELRSVMEAAGFVEAESQPWKFSHWDDSRPNVDLLWEALVEVTGVDVGSFTPTGRKAFNTALEELRQAGAAPGEMLVRGRRFFEGWKRRPKAHELKKRWAEFGPAADDRYSRGEGRRGELEQRLAGLGMGARG